MNPKYRIMPWGESLFDPVLEDYIQETYNMVEIHLSTFNPFPTAKAEFFTAPTRGVSIGECISRAKELGLEVIINLDCYKGNGRDTAESDVTAGKYHYSLYEGGVTDAINKLSKWIGNYTNIVGVQLFNEPGKHIPDDWYGDKVQFLKQKLGDSYNVVIGGDAGAIEAAAPWADSLDVHLLRSDWRDRLSNACSLAAEYGLSVLAMEMAPPLDEGVIDRRGSWNDMLIDTAVLDGISMFCGNTIDYPLSRGVRWNFKLLADFTANKNIGRTWIDEDYKVIHPSLVPPVSMANITQRQLEGRIHRRQKRLDNLSALPETDFRAGKRVAIINELSNLRKWQEQ
jgi:hypothetical protein